LLTWRQKKQKTKWKQMWRTKWKTLRQLHSPCLFVHSISWLRTHLQHQILFI
jgi:hypothetical protein